MSAYYRLTTLLHTLCSMSTLHNLDLSHTIASAMCTASVAATSITYWPLLSMVTSMLTHCTISRLLHSHMAALIASSNTTWPHPRHRKPCRSPRTILNSRPKMRKTIITFHYNHQLPSETLLGLMNRVRVSSQLEIIVSF